MIPPGNAVMFNPQRAPQQTDEAGSGSLGEETFPFRICQISNPTSMPLFRHNTGAGEPNSAPSPSNRQTTGAEMSYPTPGPLNRDTARAADSDMIEKAYTLDLLGEKTFVIHVTKTSRWSPVGDTVLIPVPTTGGRRGSRLLTHGKKWVGHKNMVRQQEIARRARRDNPMVQHLDFQGSSSLRVRGIYLLDKVGSRTPSRVVYTGVSEVMSFGMNDILLDLDIPEPIGTITNRDITIWCSTAAAASLGVTSCSEVHCIIPDYESAVMVFDLVKILASRLLLSPNQSLEASLSISTLRVRLFPGDVLGKVLRGRNWMKWNLNMSNMLGLEIKGPKQLVGVFMMPRHGP